MSIDITQTKAWHALAKHFSSIKHQTMAEMFSDNPERAQQLTLQACDLIVDFSKNRINQQTLNLLIELANTVDLSNHIAALFNGNNINTTEDRPAWHTALRDIKQHKNVQQSLQKMSLFIDSIYEGSWRGYSNKKITDVVNIGIGGSDLGPHFVTEALNSYHQNHVKVHFVSNIDGTDICNTLQSLNPETTLFIISSKSFTTIETITNAKAARKWLLGSNNNQEAIRHHFVAVSANVQRAIDFGIDEKNIFAFWDWVGGRFSLWSAIGLPIALAIGMENFLDLLDGAHAMDQHFATSSFDQNIPVIMALIGIWYINFFDYGSLAIVPYDQNLALLPAYLQQLEMESNGKSVNLKGDRLRYATAPVIWGGIGSNTQHAFHQLLHQSQRVIPVDFIIALTNKHPLKEQHQALYYNCIAQSQALLYGLTEQQAYCDLFAQDTEQEKARFLAKHKSLIGNKPSSTILLEQLTPRTLGALIAAYEHKVFVQGVIWQINSFDQFGVELGKKLVFDLQQAQTVKSANASTAQLIKFFKERNDIKN